MILLTIILKIEIQIPKLQVFSYLYIIVPIRHNIMFIVYVVY